MFETEREKWIWLACIIDTEGCLGIWKKKQPRSIIGYRYIPSFTIPNNSRDLVLMTKEICNRGSIHQNNSLWIYQLDSEGLRNTLPEVLPFLIVKRRQAELLLEALGIMKDNKKHNGNAVHFGNHELKLRENYQKLDRIKEEITTLQGYKI